MPEILEKLKSELKSGLSSSDHDGSGNDAGAQKSQATSSPGVGGVVPADDLSGGGGDPSTTAAHSDRQTLRKAAASEAGGARGAAGSGSTDIKPGGEGVAMTPPSGGVIRSEEAHARDRANSERMTLRKAAAHERGDDKGLGA